MTKGALYHHFDGKEELFAAVHAREHRRLGAAAEAAAGEARDPWAAVEAACVAFARAAREPGTQRITLHDAPLALSRSALNATPLHDLLDRAASRARSPGSCMPRRSRPPPRRSSTTPSRHRRGRAAPPDPRARYGVNLTVMTSPSRIT